MEPASEVGRYKILEELGRGGFGTVYLAQVQGRRQRKVALKMVNPGMDSPELLARFAAERDTLSLLDHPGIAQLLDAGTTDDGLPYFVMEHVAGTALVDHARRQKLTISQRLELFVPVCEAIQHAHQRGVIHRDLSANNVLVAEIDGKPMPKVIDFGIAKALEREADGAPRTAYGQVMGTPEYMSPEQILGATNEVDTRTDVYALGVQLYELLTDTLPIPASKLRGQGYFEMARIVKEEDPERPSTRVRTTTREGIVNVADRPPRLDGDLDWIAMTALAKERERRYQSAAELAEDLRRYLEHRPVLARPPNTLYRVRKFLWRRRAAVAGVASIAMAVIASFVVALTAYLDAEQSYRDFRSQEARASSEADRARKQATLAEQYRADFDRLSDLVITTQLEHEAATLWPEVPDRIPAMASWLAEVRRRITAAETMRASLSRLEADVEQEHADPIVRQRAVFLRNTTGELVAGLDRLTSLIVDVERRRAWASTVHDRTIVRHEAEWERVRTETGERYGRALDPQVGLVPLGRDDANGLQEFVLLRSGTVPPRENGELQITEASGIVLVLIPRADAWVGAQETGRHADPAAKPDEIPVRVYPTRWFFLSRYEMTQAQWVRCTGESNPSKHGATAFPGEHGLHPVESVEWSDAASALRRFGLRLPSEVEWEHACRAGTGTPWSCGADESDLEGFANVADLAPLSAGEFWCTLTRPVDDPFPFDDGHVRHAVVGSFAPNQFGIHDMHGNVAEWCADRYGSYRLELVNGLREVNSEQHVARGGSYFQRPTDCRSASRIRFEPAYLQSTLGFRPARSVDTR